MKNLILILMLMMCSLNLTWAASRFTDADRAEFLKDVKQEIAEFKLDNKGKIDLQIIKPGLYEELDKYYKAHKFTKEELVIIKENYEKFAANASNANDEEKFYKFVEDELLNINKTSIQKVKAGDICNSWICEDGLRCVHDPNQKSNNRQCFTTAKMCNNDKECCSGSCVQSPDNKNKKTCEAIKRCFAPLKEGQACNENPVCEQGKCAPYNVNTIGIGECKNERKSCKSNDECCSNLCGHGKCVENLICKNCFDRGEGSGQNGKCCEGLIKNPAGRCVPDMPPIVPPQVNNEKTKMMIQFVASLFFTNAHADEALNVINQNRQKYESMKLPEREEEIKDYTKVKADMKFTKKSNFETCDMYFREDYYAYLKENKLFDLEVALLSFDFMMSGEANDDYWRSSKSKGATSVYSRLKKVSEEHGAIRTKTNERIAEINRKLTCMCLDVKGIDKVEDPKKKDYFNNNCGEYKTALAEDVNNSSCSKNLAGENEAWTKSCSPAPIDGMTKEDCDKLRATLDSKAATCAANPNENGFKDDNKNGDASGIKAKRLLTFYSSQMSSFNQTLTVDNTKIFQGIADVGSWLEKNEEKFATTDYEYTDGLSLSTFEVKNPDGKAAAMGGVLAAIMAAGVIAIIVGFNPTAGGFKLAPFLSTWATAGIISAAAAAGAGGVWLAASLKGAWSAKHPEVYDQFIRSYSCGKKDTCKEYTRRLKQPFSNICDAHISNGACIKNFVVANIDDEDRYIVDPFIPAGVSKDSILRGQPDYAKSLEGGYQRALSYMKGASPRGRVDESVMTSEFISQYVVGLYTPDPGFGASPEDRYFMNDKLIGDIKTKAGEFAVKEKFLDDADADNKKIFGDYAYTYHFLWPKMTYKDEISYPTIAFGTYLEYMSFGVTANLSAGGSKAAATFAGLNTKYLQDYVNTLKMYQAQGNNTLDGDSIKAEISQAESEINANKVVHAMIDSNSSLTNLDQNAINTTASKLGISGGVTLTSGQSEFLNAIGNYRNLRNQQLKKAEAYQKAVKSGSNRSNAVASAMKNFGSKFSNPLSSKGGGGSIFGNTSGSSGSSSTTKAEDGVSGHTSSGNGNNSLYMNEGSGGGGGYSSGSRSSGASSGGSSSGGASTAMSEDEDSKRLNEAVDARDRANQSKYNSTDGNSLFEKVTNAYIRNYDKVLTKKKQEKEVIEQK